MRKAVRQNPSKKPVSRTAVIPAPVKGWTASKSPMEAEEGTAILLDNWFPEATSIRPRKGYAEHVTGIADEVQTLMTYVSGTTKNLFAAGNGEIYDVTSAGAVGAAAISGLTSDKWQYINHATTAGQYLYMVNGSDSARHYNGTTWATPAITGVTSADLIDILSHKSRIWFVEKESTTLWYLPVDSIAGAATAFEVGAQLRYGGSVMSIANWSIDGGDGPDDVLAIWSTEGEVLVYAGSDPGSDYAIIGRYKAARPIGRRCMHPIGGDVAMISEDGVLALSNILRSDRLTAKEKSLTAAIVDEYLKMAKANETVFGWQMVVYPHASMALLNIPGAADDGASWQFAYNVSTKAWSRFKGWNALCWVYHDMNIYFGAANGNVYLAEYGASDDGSTIDVACLPAFNHLKAQGQTKHVKAIQPIYSTDVTGQPLGVYCAINFEEPVNAPTEVPSVVGLFTWDVSAWDGSAVWGGLAVVDSWRGSGNIGYVISPYTVATVEADAVPDFNFSLIGWHIVYETGGLAFTA